MDFLEYFQVKCPACKTKLKPRALGNPKVFSSEPTSAGPCAACKAPLQWVRSWTKAMVFFVFGLMCVTLFTIIFSMVFQRASINTGGIVGISLAMGFMSSKALAVAQTPPHS